MKQAKLKELFDYLPKSKVQAGDGLVEGVYPFYTSSENQTKYLNEYQHDPGCLVFGTGGKASVHFTTKYFSTSTDCITIKAKPDVGIDACYVFQYFKGNMQVLENGFKGAGLKHISKAYLSDIQIPYPEEVDDQRRIAYLLCKVEGLIAQRKKHLQQLDDLLRSVFLVMFGDLKISEGESTLEDCLKIQQGFAFKSEEFIDSGTPIIKIGTVNKGFFDYSTLSFIAGDYPEKIRRFEIKPGDLLISLTGTVGKDDYGNTCFVPINAAHHTYLLNQRVGKLVCDRNIAHPIFIDSFLKLPKVKSALIKQNRGVRQANLSNSDIYGIQLSIPPVDQQRKFAVIVEKVEGIKSRYQKSLTDLEALYGALGQQAFKGELDLSRVAMPAALIEGESPMAAAVPAPITTPVIELPETDLLMPALQDRTQLAPLLSFWLEDYRAQLGRASFSLECFITAAQTRLAELHPNGDFDLGVNDYECIKAWVFKALADGRLAQAFDDDGNRIELKSVQA